MSYILSQTNHHTVYKTTIEDTVLSIHELNEGKHDYIILWDEETKSNNLILPQQMFGNQITISTNVIGLSCNQNNLKEQLQWVINNKLPKPPQQNINTLLTKITL